MIWRLLLSPPMYGPDNMALDVALMARARRTGETVLRVYGWRMPVLSLGRHQRAVHEFDIHAIERAGVDVVRRPTGGRSLLHHHEITYSVTAPAAGTLGDAYAGVNALLVNALGALGVPVSVAAPAPRAARPSSTPCFAEPAAGELVAGGAKLVGSAQWRDSGSMLQHGSILVDDDQPALSALMLRPPAAVPPAATLRALLGRVPSAAEVAGHLRDAVRAHADPGADWLELERDVADEAARCALRFRDPAWTWRR